MSEVDESRANIGLPRINRFTLLERIAMGGMGELYAAYDAQLDRKIALKLVRTGRGGREAEARLLREAQALGRLSHPNVVTVYEAGIAADRVFVAMEFVHGQTLTVWLAEQQARPEPERVAELLARFADAGRGLAAVHRAGLAHRDFKPDNVLVGTDGRVRVVDFGLARSVIESSGERSSTGALEASSSGIAAIEVETDRLESMLTPELETRAGTVVGTPRYMAPEQWGGRRSDSRSDQFSFCVALYWALFTSWPFAGDVASGLRAAVLGGDLREPPRKPEVPARLHAALLRGLAREPEDRFPDMAELLAAIDEALAPRRPRSSVWLGMVALALVGAGVLALRRPESTPLPLDSSRDRIEREIAAERRRVQIDQQVEALSSAGEHDEADAVFEAFASQPEYADTRALALAWLDRARRLRARGEQPAELAALGEAQRASVDPDLRRQASIELARVFLANHQYEPLAGTLAMLEPLDGPPIDPALQPELVGMRIREAASRRDFVGALERLREPGGDADAELRPLLEQLAHAHPTAYVVPTANLRGAGLVELPSLDLDGDLRGELVLAPSEGPLQLLGSNLDLPILQAIDRPSEGSKIPPTLTPTIAALGRPGAPDWVVTHASGHRTLLALSKDADANAVVAQALEPASNAAQWAIGDLFDGPGWAGWEGWGADGEQRRLRGLHADGTEFVPDPSLLDLRSVVETLTVLDLDGDGSDELVVGVGAWWAYDVRVLIPQRETPGRFELAARHKLGAIDGLVGMPALRGPGHWIAVSMPTTPPSPRVFPSEAPAGVPSGVYMLAWAGEGQPLEIVDQVAVPGSFRPAVGDLDGDDRSELVVQMPTAIAVLRANADDHYTPLWIDGLHYHALVDLDDDDDDELIVSALTGDDAGRLFVLGSGDQPMPTEVRGSSSSSESSEPPAELDRAPADPLDELATPEHRLEFDFHQPLDPGWRIARPGLLRHEPEGLRVDAMGARDPILMRRAIVWTGERLELELDVDLLRLEWASSVTIELVPVDTAGQAKGPAVASRRIGSWGGGGYYMLDLSEGLPLERGAVGASRVMQGAMPPVGQHRLRVRVELLAGAEHTWSKVTTIDGTGPRDSDFELQQPVGSVLVPGRYELRLQTGIEPWVRGAIRLERLRVLGARDDPQAPPPTRRERVLLAAANGEHARALELLESIEPGDPIDPRDASWLRALALEQLGRWPLAQPLIEHAIGDCEGPEALARFGHAMLLQPDRLGPTLRRICPPDRFLLDTWAVMRVSLYQHKDLPDLHRTLTTQLVDLDHDEPRDLEQALATMGLLTSRARGWLMQDLASAAESDLRRAIELGERWIDAPPGDPSEDGVRRVIAIAHIELALVLMTRDRLDAAAAELERALIEDLEPELIADLIVARGVFDPLRGTALGSTIDRARLGLWRRPADPPG